MCIIDSRTGWMPCLEPELWTIYRDLAADRGMFYCGSTPSWPLMGWKVDDDQCDPALASQQQRETTGGYCMYARMAMRRS